MYHHSHGKSFRNLLTWRRDQEFLTIDDEDVYENAVNYTGLIFRSILDGTDVTL